MWGWRWGEEGTRYFDATGSARHRKVGIKWVFTLTSHLLRFDRGGGGRGGDGVVCGWGGGGGTGGFDAAVSIRPRNVSSGFYSAF